MGSDPQTLSLIAGLIPLVIITGIVVAIMLVSGARAARQQRTLDRILEQNERQTALLKELLNRSGPPPAG
ncbi:hypothetical protein [Vannielia sp. SX4]|uniref:hypothetical protein n=1 Tax=Vannielia sp. SX4 TaxID=3463852 RepID=UPI004058FEFD